MNGPISIFEGEKGKLQQEFSRNKKNTELLQAGNNGRCSKAAAIATVLSEPDKSKEPSLLPNDFHKTLVKHSVVGRHGAFTKCCSMKGDAVISRLH